MSLPENVTVKTIESGHAAVYAPLRKGGRVYRVGTVTREKFGSTRTGTHWIARDRGGYRIGTALTRDEAAALFAPKR